MVQLNTRGIPKGVLSGRNKKFIQVSRLYKALMLREYYRLLNESLWRRGRGEDDPVAGEWEPLKRTTKRIKTKIADLLGSYKLFYDWYSGVEESNDFAAIREGTTKGGKLQKTILSPEQQRFYDKVVKAEIEEQAKKDKPPKSPEAKRLAAKKAWKSIQEKYGDREFVDIINYRTGRLFGSTVPGQVVNSRYYPSSKDQQFKITENKIVISFDAVPHADSVDKGSYYTPARQLLPDDNTAWIEQAHERIIEEVKILYDSMRSRIKDRKEQASREDRRKPISRLKARGSRNTSRRKTSRNRRPVDLGDVPF